MPAQKKKNLRTGTVYPKSYKMKKMRSFITKKIVKNSVKIGINIQFKSSH